jgi:hypothetical protein
MLGVPDQATIARPEFSGDTVYSFMKTDEAKTPAGYGICTASFRPASGVAGRAGKLINLLI